MTDVSLDSRFSVSFSLTDSEAITYHPETRDHDAQIEQINKMVFGPGRFTRASYLLREEGRHNCQFSFVACLGGNVIGSVRMTPITVGEQAAYLLGPLVVRPEYKNAGVGRKLMYMTLHAAKNHNVVLVILIGDKKYYGRFGFKNVEHKQIHMPAPVDPKRLLILELQEGALLKVAKGKVRYRSCN
ncbi:GNAT family N-acetyltransferase [Bartonella bacilliformis]|uniref:N-acetyltransferase domain-containing protein n=1 Tax=Bartonella bacilliformis Ver097 TaxID=1293911 RepID=A0A072R044_BARBA|nr:N-acetyltransferase [Bartonella bacilliformis]KEG19278.1 hypothetical protein H710_01058 [Bartonella bacilliformis Ver097]